MTNTSKQALRRERILAATLTVLLGAVLLTSHAVSGAMAKYTTAASSSDEARVALFGHSEKIEFPATMREHLVPGATSTVYLTVSNKDGNKISEVAQAYEIEIVTSGNLPITFAVFKADGIGKVDWTKVGEVFRESSANKSATFSTIDGSMTFQPGKEGTDYYKIEISWPSGDNRAVDYSNIPDFMQVNINVKQID